VPERIFPIFRDREELPASANLASHINKALCESRYLIVICSPRAAKSQWVAEEIRAFKALGRDDRVLALIVDGEPNAGENGSGFTSDDECFPNTLRYSLDQDGQPTAIPTEPIAADAREDRDGKLNAKIKLLAGLLDVPYDDLKRRDHERRSRRARVLGSIAFVLVALFGVLAALALFAAKRASLQERKAQQLLVASDLSRAEELFNQNEAGGAIAFLARALENERGTQSVAADRLWFALTQRAWPMPISIPMHHTDSILSASFSPDGTKLVTASRDSTARIWDAESGAAVGQPLPHPRLVRRALFTPNGRYIFTICFDGIGRFWDSSSGQSAAISQIVHSESISSAAFSGSGGWIATGSTDGMIKISDATTGSAVAQVRRKENVHTLVFDPTDDQRLLSVSGKNAELWKLPEGRGLFQLHHEGDVNSAQFTPSGEWIVTASSDQSVRVWDGITGSPKGEPIKHDGAVEAALLSPNGQLIATVIGKRLLIWEIGMRQRLVHTFEHNQRVTCTRFSPDGYVVFAGTQDGQVVGHNILTGETVGESIKEDSAIVSIDIGHDGKRLLVATASGSARIWRPALRYATAECLTHRGAVESMNLSPDDRLLVTGSTDSKARVWNLRKRTAIELIHGGSVLSTALSPNGTYTLTASADAKTRLWFTDSGQPVHEPVTHETVVSNVTFAPSGDFFAIATEDGDAQFWDLSSGHPIGKPMHHGARLSNIEFNYDGTKFVTAGMDGAVQLWQSRTGEHVGTPLKNGREVTCAHFSPRSDVIAAGTRGGIVTIWSSLFDNQPHQFTTKTGVTQLAFSPSGYYLACGSEDGIATVRDIRTDKFVGDPLRHPSAISAITFDPDSSRIATASEDGSIRLWDTATGRPLTEILHHQKAVRQLRFSRDGRILFSASRDSTVKVWDVSTGLMPADRTWLVAFCREVAPVLLSESGLMTHRSIGPEDVVRSTVSSDSASGRALAHWFFDDGLRRSLTPYAQTSMKTYVARLIADHSPSSLSEASFYSMEDRIP
jgi:WD40 repeat protein